MLKYHLDLSTPLDFIPRPFDLIPSLDCKSLFFDSLAGDLALSRFDPYRHLTGNQEHIQFNCLEAMQAMLGLEENELLQFCSPLQISQATLDRARELLQVLWQHPEAEVAVS